MDIFAPLINLLKPLTFLAMSGGVAWGIVCGALPGLGATIGIALLIPFTFGMDPIIALPMLAGVYAGAIYGGGITAVLLGVPGTSADAATVFDGHPLAKKGLANKGLTASVSASAFGGMFSALVLLVLAPPLARVSLAFGPPEYFLVAIFGLTIIAALSTDSIMKGVLAGILGLFLGTIGIDPITGDMRFTFGAMYLFDGFPLIPLILGLFAFPRCLMLIGDLVRTGSGQISVDTRDGGGPKLSWLEIWAMKLTYLRSAFLGTLIGIIPGAGANIACFVGYAAAKRASKTPEKFGTGIPEGVAASEAANNGVCNGSLVPLLTLSIPGSPTAAVILGALMIHGLVPGADLFTKNAEVTYTFILAGFFANLVMLVMGWYGSRWFAKIVQVPTTILAPAMLLISLVGAFTVRQYTFDVGVTIGIGTAAYFLTRAGFPMASILLGVILGPMAEAGLRRALLIGHGDLTIFLTRPLSLALIILTVASLFAGMRMQKRTRALEAEIAGKS
ncbi:MAG: C4-dicarboxylate ABC transporter permease [Hyphomicrobiales bacterium]|nr:MAG: C4-dicarboxylate ABC transporter permease [Hyphomicrobiales bacterium]